MDNNCDDNNNTNFEYTELLVSSLMNPSGDPNRDVSTETFLTDEDSVLRNLLNSWGFGHLFELLKSEEITLERLLYITEEDLKELLKAFKLGVRIEFRRKLTEWKIQSNVTTWSTCDTVTNSDVPSEKEATAGPSSGSSSSNNAPSHFSKSFNILEVVKESAGGDYVFRTFDKNKKLDDAARKIIIDAVIAWHMQHSVRITRPMFESLATEIERHFNDNKSIYYKKVANIPSGRLYDRYQNHSKRLRKLGILPSPVSSPTTTATTPTTVTESEESVEHCENDEIQNNKLWLELNTSPWTDVKAKWERTCKLRRKEILDSTNNTSNVVSCWPLYKHADGFTLIELDFSNLYKEECYNLLRGWDGFKALIIPYLNSKVKDKQNVCVLKMLNTLKSDDAPCNLIVALLLHSVLPPTVKHTVKKDNKKVVLKSTIKDSQDSFFMHVVVNNDFERKLDVYRTTLLSRNETLQPIIIGIGADLLNIREFIVYYDEIKYKFTNFLAAFDCCFKIFHVLNLHYPKDSQSFWIFIQKYFFHINSAHDNMTPSVLCLMQDLN